MIDILLAALLGFIEGLTEFIPVSSTGHLVLLVDVLGFRAPPGRVFEVFIQMGAILAVMVLFRRRIIDTVLGLPKERSAQKFTLNLIAATLPAMIVGALAYHFIKAELYNATVIAVSLIIGGIVILLVDRFAFRKAEAGAARIESVDDIPLKTALLIGCCQMVALIPGVSRSGATIIGALLLGLSRPVAAEFSFFMAMPVMAAAVAYDLWNNWQALAAYDGLHLLVIGFICAFLTAMAVVKLVMKFIGTYGFAPFGWYRIVLGLLVLAFVL